MVALMEWLNCVFSTIGTTYSELVGQNWLLSLVFGMDIILLAISVYNALLNDDNRKEK